MVSKHKPTEGMSPVLETELRKLDALAHIAAANDLKNRATELVRMGYPAEGLVVDSEIKSRFNLLADYEPNLKISAGIADLSSSMIFKVTIFLGAGSVPGAKLENAQEPGREYVLAYSSAGYIPELSYARLRQPDISPEEVSADDSLTIGQIALHSADSETFDEATFMQQHEHTRLTLEDIVDASFLVSWAAVKQSTTS